MHRQHARHEVEDQPAEDAVERRRSTASASASSWRRSGRSTAAGAATVAAVDEKPGRQRDASPSSAVNGRLDRDAASWVARLAFDAARRSSASPGRRRRRISIGATQVTRPSCSRSSRPGQASSSMCDLGGSSGRNGPSSLTAAVFGERDRRRAAARRRRGASPDRRRTCGSRRRSSP